MTRFLFICLILCFFCKQSIGFSQNYLADVGNFLNELNTIDTLKINMETYLFSEDNNNKQTLMKGEIIKLKNLTFIKTDLYSVLDNEEEQLYLNHTLKTGYLQNSTKKKNMDRMLHLDTNSNYYDSIIVLNSHNNMKGYSIYRSEGEYPKTSIWFDSITHMLTKIEFFFKPVTKDYAVGLNKTQVSYTYQKKIDTNDLKRIKMSYYFTKKRKELVPSQVFSSYVLTENK